jgi:hypothetical protein
MIRRLIALTAAYAIALQAALAGFATFAVPAFARSAICAPAGSDPGPGPAPRPECVACPTVCHGAGADGMASVVTVLVPPTPSLAIDRRLDIAAPRPAPRLLPPSRAPPA